MKPQLWSKKHNIFSEVGVFLLLSLSFLLLLLSYQRPLTFACKHQLPLCFLSSLTEAETKGLYQSELSCGREKMRREKVSRTGPALCPCDDLFTFKQCRPEILCQVRRYLDSNTVALALTLKQMNHDRTEVPTLSCNSRALT